MSQQQTSLPDWLHDFPYEIQPWPTMVGPEKREELRRATLGCARLIKSIPERILGGDPERISDFYGVGDPALVALMIEPPNGIDEAFVRCDFVDTADGLQCVEVNTTACLGGWQLGFWAETVRTEPTVARFLERHGIRLDYRDSLRLMLEHVIRNGARRATDGFLNLAVIVSDDFPSLRQAEGYFDRIWRDLLAEILPGADGTVDFCRSGRELAAHGSEVRHGDRPIHVVIEYTSEDTPAPVYRRFKAGDIDLYNGPIAGQLGNKRGLALLSRLADSDQLDAAERDLVHAHVPWTREVAPGPVRRHGRRVELRDLLLQEQADLVLKACRGARGEGVYIGLHTPRDVWREAVDRALLTSGWIAQERLASLPFLYQQGNRGSCVHDVVWGMFCFGRTYGGGFLRMMPRGAGDGIVNAARGASEGCLFEVL